MIEKCNECGESCKVSTGRYVNRVVDFNTYTTRKIMGKPYQYYDYICPVCADKIYEKEIK